MDEREHSLPPDSAEPDPNYRAVLDWVWSFSARPRTADEIVGQRAIKLERMRALLHLLGDPHLAVPSLLVAGTKGKGSTVAMLAACLRAAGRRTGRYTSPHLVNWRERTAIDDEPISTERVLALAEPIRAAVEALPSELGAADDVRGRHRLRLPRLRAGKRRRRGARGWRRRPLRRHERGRAVGVDDHADQLRPHADAWPNADRHCRAQGGHPAPGSARRRSAASPTKRARSSNASPRSSGRRSRSWAANGRWRRLADARDLD